MQQLAAILSLAYLQDGGHRSYPLSACLQGRRFLLQGSVQHPAHTRCLTDISVTFSLARVSMVRCILQ